MIIRFKIVKIKKEETDGPENWEVPNESEAVGCSLSRENETRRVRRFLLLAVITSETFRCTGDRRSEGKRGVGCS